MSRLCIAAAALLCVACADSKVINGKTVPPYGLFNPEERDPDVHYELCTGNAVWSFVLFETVIAPVILCGYGLYEPVGPK